MTKKSPEIILLRQAIEHSVNRLMRTPSDFEFLAGAIWERIHVTVSPTTLKRLWGYIDGADVTRPSTLNLLSQFLGFQHWEAFVADALQKSPEESDFLASDGVRVSELEVGDKVEVSWLPNRRCVFVYRGENHFEVVEAENSKLFVGNTFDCAFFFLKEPLFIDNLVQNNHAPVGFVCGSKGGLVNVRVLGK